MKKEKTKILVIIIFLTIIDQLIKFIIIFNNEILPIQIINNVLQISYHENFGMAFGIATKSRIMFIIVNIIIIGIASKFLFTQEANLSKSKEILLSMIVAGGMGNLIDRVFRGYVIDYIDFTPIINYPIFNFADTIIVIGTIVFAILIISDMICENKKKRGS